MFVNISKPGIRSGLVELLRILLALTLAFSLWPAAGSALVSTTIAIDGDMSDWEGVRADAANRIVDSLHTDPDPDMPGSDRDLYLGNVTWDSDYLYIAFRRTSGGNKNVTYAAYVDLDGDGVLHDDDVVIWWTSNSGSPQVSASAGTAGVFRYNQARIGDSYVNPDGDPMGGDGVAPAGWADSKSAQAAPSIEGWSAPSGIELEGRIAWADLGVAPGSPVAIHVVSANGEIFGSAGKPNDPGQIQDNMETLWSLRARAVDVEPDHARGGLPGTELVYTHTVTNNSNVSDVFDLRASSSQGWPVTITDLEGNPISDVALNAEGQVVVRVSVAIPPETAEGAVDVTTLSVVSRADTSVMDRVRDSTTVGRVTVTPAQSGYMAPGHDASYPFDIANNMDSAGIFDLRSHSSNGFVALVEDANGAPLPSVPLAPGSSVRVYLRVSVPATAAVGTQDVTRLTAELQSDPSVLGHNVALTKVSEALTITPEHSYVAIPGAALDYEHTIRNSTPATRTVTLSATSSQGWPLRCFAADGVTPVTALQIGPNGSEAHVIVRVTVPSEASEGVADTTVVTAASDGDVSLVADTSKVRTIAVYDSTGYTEPADVFDLGQSFYGRAGGLAPRDTVVFVWKDPSGTILRTSPERTVDAMGMAFDTCPSTFSDPTGMWSVSLCTSSKGVPGAPVASDGFMVRAAGEILEVSATDAPGPGQGVAVSSTLRNVMATPVTGSSITYTIWWDEDGDGVFGTGDTYIDGSGAPRIWNGVDDVITHVTTGVDIAGEATWAEPAPWTIDNQAFPYEGEYKITARWDEAGGNTIDRATSTFYSIPALGGPLFGFIMLSFPVLMCRRLRLAPCGVSR